MGQLADHMQGTREGEQATMAMIADSEGPPARVTPPLFDVQFQAGKNRVVWPAIWHTCPLLPANVFGNKHTSHYRILH
jgi:hypothetical protein